MSLLHDRGQTVKSERVTYTAIPQDERATTYTLGGVCLLTVTGAASVQDYLSPERAEDLAAALLEVARVAREVNAT